MKDNKPFFINRFYLKIIALILMTFGLIGEALLLHPAIQNSTYNMAFVFSIVGKTSIPLFCFFTIESLIYTSSRKKYILFLSFLELICLSLGAIGQYGFNKVCTSNFITDILTSVIFITLLQSKNEKLYFVSVLVFLYVGLSYFANGYETLNELKGMTILWFPSFLRCRYPLYSFLIIVLGYFSIYILKRFNFNSIDLKNVDNKELLTYKEYRFGFNVLIILIVVLINGLFYLISALSNRSFDVFDTSYQMYSILGCFSLFFYNGEKGYNKKWFKWFNYSYYPILICLSFGIVLLLIL